MTKLEKEIRSNFWDVRATETNLRKWERRLIVALTSAEKERCKYFIKMYKNIIT